MVHVILCCLVLVGGASSLSESKINDALMHHFTFTQMAATTNDVAFGL